MKQIRSLFPTIEIPDPLFFKVHPWADGCSYWAPGPHGAYDFNKVSKASVKPLPDVPNLYMCNESWAYEQCWVKCSIDQAQKVIDIIELTLARSIIQGNTIEVFLEKKRPNG